MRAQLKWLAELQDAVGVWHDLQVFHQAVAKAVARAEILLSELPNARILLAELETERSRQADDVKDADHFIDHEERIGVSPPRGETANEISNVRVQ